jgi:hypothetical protein
MAVDRMGDSLMTICKDCKNAETNGGKCREFQLSDGYYTWRTPISKNDCDLEQSALYNGAVQDYKISQCVTFAKIEAVCGECGHVLSVKEVDLLYCRACQDSMGYAELMS